jgi:hypothetical protein
MTPEDRNKWFGRAVIILMGLLFAAYMAATFLR